MVESSNNVCMSFTTHFVFIDEKFGALVVGMIIFINHYRMPPMLCMTMREKLDVKVYAVCKTYIMSGF
jgi:hypothetical protein